MKHSVLLILFLLVSVSVSAQTDSSYKEIDLGFLRMTIPAFFVDQKVKGIEGGAYEYKGRGLTLSVDYNPACFRPTFERTDPAYDYAEEALSIDGIRAKIWSMRGNPFTAGANYGTIQGKVGLGIYLSGNDNDREKVTEMARKIFLSVKFAPKKNS